MSGFVYIWRDRKHNRYYIGSHWGSDDDGYVCSSQWMKRSFSRRPNDFKRRIISRVHSSRLDLLKEESKWLSMIKPDEIKVRYYNLMLRAPEHWYHYEQSRLSVGEKISKAKKGTNTGPRDSSIGQKISESKKKKCVERREQTGSSFSEEHRKAMSECKIGTKQSEESNKKRSETLKQKYESGELVACRATQSKESNRKRSEALKGLKRSNDTKKKMSNAQSKQYRIMFDDGTENVVLGLKPFCIENNIPYVTARKALESGSKIEKYGILSIIINIE
jgi:hypothetical protein